MKTRTFTANRSGSMPNAFLPIEIIVRRLLALPYVRTKSRRDFRFSGTIYARGRQRVRGDDRLVDDG